MLSTYGESGILLAKGSLGVVTKFLTLLFYTFSALISRAMGDIIPPQQQVGWQLIADPLFW